MQPILVIAPRSSTTDSSPATPPTASTSACKICGAAIPLTEGSISWFNKPWSFWSGGDAPTLQQLKDSSPRCPLCHVFYQGLLACVPGINPSTRVRDVIGNGGLGHPKLILETKAPPMRVEFFALQGAITPCKNIRQGTWVSGDTSSESAMQTMRKWLETCESSHPRCRLRNSSFFPTRILDVGTRQGDRIKLYEPHFRGNHGRYTTLSHCWGESQPVKTTLATLQERKREIPWFSLPRTFQDAITITRRRGIQYIWIDSLCIIQDDPDDWRNEASLMCNVYQNAWLNLAATKSSDCHGGLFSTIPQTEITFTNGLCRFNVCARQAIEHSKLLPGEGDASFPLLSRGWVYQERLLARRVLHFGPQEMFWECQEELACECSAISEPVTAYGETYVAPKIQHGLFISDHGSHADEVSERWHQVIMEYSNLRLSHPSDIFPALAGLAKQFHQHLEDQYLAGLWRSTLVQDLAWRVHKPTGSSRPLWRAPSWSWAAIDEPIEYIRQVTGHRRTQGEAAPQIIPVATVRDVHCTPLGRDAMGELEGAYLKLSGCIVPAYLGICYRRYKPHYEPAEYLDWTTSYGMRTQEECNFLNSEVDKEPDYEYLDGDEACAFLQSRELWKVKYYVRVDGEVEGLANMDIRFFDNNTDILKEKENIFCLKLTKVLFPGDGTVNYDSLVLKHHGEGIYERIGLVRAGDDWYSGRTRVETLTIV